MIDTYKREIKACKNIIMVQKDNESKLINGLKKLKENQKAANQENDLVSLFERRFNELEKKIDDCLLYTSPSPRDGLLSRMPSSA